MRVAALRARVLLRNNVGSTLALALIAGLAAAVPVAAWAAASQTERALPDFVERIDPPDASVFFCPQELGSLADVDPDSPTGRSAQEACARHDQLPERDQLAAMPETASALRMTGVVGQIQTGEGRDIALIYVRLDPGEPRPDGPGELIEGRWFRDGRLDELVVSEAVAAPRHIEVGTTAKFTPYLMTQADCAGEGSCEPAGEPGEVTVVGIVRQASDLAANTTDSGAMFLPAAWWDRFGGDDPFRYGIGSQVWANPGVTPEQLEAAIDRRFPGRAFFESPLPDEVDTLDEAIGYEARAAQAFAAVAGLAALVFVGQAIVRQARREATDLPIFMALGAGRRAAIASTLLRSAVTTILAALTATIAVYLGSPIGPVGVARRAQTGSRQLDVPILLVGLAALATTICALGAAPAWSAFVPGRRGRTDRPSIISRWAAGLLAPTASTGVAAALPRPRSGGTPLGSAIVTTAGAAAAIVAAVTLSASLASVLREPFSYGAVWDVAVGNIDSPATQASASAAVATTPGVIGAVGIYDGTAFVDELALPLVAFVPIPGVADFDPAIVNGRAPSRPGEIALGSNSMRELRVALGDEIRFVLQSSGHDRLRATVVGQAVLNNTFSLEAGTGGLVDPDWIVPLAAGQPQQIAVRIDPEADRSAVLDALEQAFPTTVVGPTPPTGVRNLARIDGIPALLASVIGALALAALAHALAVSVRARRLELAVLRCLGFTRRQVAASVAWQASTLGVVAAVVGVPFGLIVGRWGWSMLASDVGLTLGAVVEATTSLLVGVGVVAVALVLAILPGWRATRTRPAVALRASG
ncbi:MAG: FtsX-like permease family protein [Acidimicrobiales bacterium]